MVVKLNKNIYSSTYKHRLQDNFFYHVHSYYVNTNDTDIVLSYSYNNEFEYISSTCKNNIYDFNFIEKWK